MKTIPLKTLLERIQLLPWNIIPVNSQFSAPLHETYIIHACNHFPELVAMLKQFEVLAHGNGRITNDSMLADALRKVLTDAETVQIEE